MVTLALLLSCRGSLWVTATVQSYEGDLQLVTASPWWHDHGSHVIRGQLTHTYKVAASFSRMIAICNNLLSQAKSVLKTARGCK